MAIIKVKKLPKNEYEITHDDGRIQVIEKTALKVAIKVKDKEIKKGQDNLSYKKDILKEINKIK